MTRRAAHDPLVALVLGVEDAQRVDVEPRLRVLRELAAEALEVVHEQRAVGGPAGAVADRVELELEAVEQAELGVPGRLQRDHLGVDGRVVRAERLHAELPVLAVAAALGPRVAEHRRDVPELDRLRLARLAVLEVGAHDGRRALGPQRQLAAAAIGERVHLLADDVGGVARRAREERRVLERRRDDLAEAGALEDAHGGLDDELPQRDARRQPVDRGDGGAHGLAHRRSSSRNGLEARSSPSVVGSPCPDKTGVSGGNSSSSDAMLACSVGQSPPTQIGAADGAAEEHVAGVERAVYREGQAARGVARDEAHVDRIGAQLQPLAAVQEHVGLVRLGVVVARIVAPVELPQPWRLAAAAVYWRSCGTGHGGQCADVVDVSVRDKYCDRFELSLLDHGEDQGGFGAWVDYQASRLVRAADQVAVGLVWADGELEGSGGDRRLLDVRTSGTGRIASGRERESVTTVEVGWPFRGRGGGRGAG